MKASRKVALAAFLSCLWPSAAQAGSPCWFPKERDAAQVQAFRTMLMVDALHCRRRYEPAADAYNRFVTEQSGLLRRHARVLEKRFEREHGDNARGALDQYNTALANQYARNFDHYGRCRAIVPLAGQAAGADGENLLLIARAYTSRPVERTCDFWDRLS